MSTLPSSSQSSASSSSVNKKKPNKVIKLKSSDGIAIEIEESMVVQSEVIKFMVDDCGDKEEEVTVAVNVTAHILELILEWCAQDKNDYKFTQWERSFVWNMDLDDLYDLLIACNYLSIKPLFDLGCGEVVNRLRGKNAQQIRQIFNIKNDFSPEEQDDIRKEEDVLAGRRGMND